MTLMPDADARHVMATLLGDLIALPWRRAHSVPSGTVLSRWRAAIGPAPIQQLQRELLRAVVTEHRHDAAGPPGIEVGGGLRVGAIDGTVTRVPDTPANREQFGTAGAAQSGYPQVRHLHASDAFTRASLAAVTGPAGGDKAEAEQVLLDRMLIECAWVFGPDRLWVMDRNFPGVPRIKRMLATGTHVLIRVKSDIRLNRIGAFAPDGSYLARLSGGGLTLTMRVVGVPREPGRGDHARTVRPGHRTPPRHHPLRRRHRRPVHQGPPRRAARRGPAPVFHHRPPHPDHHRPGRDRHRQPAHPDQDRRAPQRPSPTRHRPHHHRPEPAPPTKDQEQSAVRARPDRHHHPHRPHPDPHLRHLRSLNKAHTPTLTTTWHHRPDNGTRCTRPDRRAITTPRTAITLRAR